MAKKDINESIVIPEGVTVDIKDNTVTVKGEKGELSRLLQGRGITLRVEENNVIIEAPQASQREKKLSFTFKAHIANMIRGVQEGFTYKLKICSGHFPMSVALKGDIFEIKNFIGEKVPRTLKIKPGATVNISGDEIVVTGIDKELVGQAAADIEKLTRRPGFDRRIFQDGIYITEKAGKVL